MICTGSRGENRYVVRRIFARRFAMLICNKAMTNADLQQCQNARDMHGNNNKIVPWFARAWAHVEGIAAVFAGYLHGDLRCWFATKQWQVLICNKVKMRVICTAITIGYRDLHGLAQINRCELEEILTILVCSRAININDVRQLGARCWHSSGNM